MTKAQNIRAGREKGNILTVYLKTKQRKYRITVAYMGVENVANMQGNQKLYFIIMGKLIIL